MMPLTKDEIQGLWAWFLGRWAQRWAATRKQAEEQIGEDALIDVWQKDLEGLSIEDLLRGFQKTRHLDWPPGSGEFRRYCLFTPEDGGYLPARAAYDEAIEQIGRMAVMRQWSCEAVRQTAEAMASALRYGGEQVFEQFQERYTKKCFLLHHGSFGDIVGCGHTTGGALDARAGRAGEAGARGRAGVAGG